MNKKKSSISRELEGERFDKALAQTFSELSRKKIKTLIDSGGAYLNKKRIQRAGVVVHAGDDVELFWRDEEKVKGRPKIFEENLVFVCDDYLILNKPAGLPTQATLDSVEGTVIEALRVDVDFQGDLFLVHRLDKNTSGLLIIARKKSFQSYFEGLFVKRMVKKTYLGVASGVPSPNRGIVEDSIKKDSVGHNRYVVARGKKANSGASKSAVTKYSVLAFDDDMESSLIEFSPKTGRTHQLRVHAAQSLNCPLLGDHTYATQVVGHSVHRQVTRHMLHAWKIKFPLESGEWPEYTAPYPGDFKDCLVSCGISF